MVLLSCLPLYFASFNFHSLSFKVSLNCIVAVSFSCFIFFLLLITSGVLTGIPGVPANPGSPGGPCKKDTVSLHEQKTQLVLTFRRIIV